MENKTIQRVSTQVYKQFPEVKGVQPKIRRQPQSRQAPDGSFLLTYTTHVPLPNGKELPRSIRVVADETGKIIKISTSKG